MTKPRPIYLMLGLDEKGQLLRYFNGGRIRRAIATAVVNWNRPFSTHRVRQFYAVAWTGVAVAWV